LLNVGDEVKTTIDSYTSPGLVFLCHADAAAVEADYQRIRQLERDQALYIVEPPQYRDGVSIAERKRGEKC